MTELTFLSDDDYFLMVKKILSVAFSCVGFKCDDCLFFVKDGRCLDNELKTLINEIICNAERRK